MADRLVARSRRLDRPVDLLAAAGGGVLFERGRSGLAGQGVAATVRADEAGDRLASVEVDDEVGAPGCGAVAFGALPFAPDPAAPLIVPEVVWGVGDDGTAWVTTIGTDPGEAPPVPALPPPAPPPGRVEVAPTLPAEQWCELVAGAVKDMRAAAKGGLRKVVLAREIAVAADRPFDAATVVARLRSSYPGCFLFHVDGFVGASPELLVSRSGDIVRAQPMAGTARRGGDPAADARLAAGLLASSTYRQEHQITIDMVYDALVGWCSYLDYEAEPSVVGVANVQHLATMVEGRLSHPAPSVLELVAALHPTPAVAGWPREEAVAWIDAHEGFDRGRYAGAVGWVDGRGNGTWAVSIRCAQLAGREARLYAGNGIVADSDPVTELAETQHKLQAMLSALVRV